MLWFRSNEDNNEQATEVAASAPAEAAASVPTEAAASAPYDV
jgi:hypothetical protein